MFLNPRKVPAPGEVLLSVLTCRPLRVDVETEATGQCSETVMGVRADLALRRVLVPQKWPPSTPAHRVSLRVKSLALPPTTALSTPRRTISGIRVHVRKQAPVSCPKIILGTFWRPRWRDEVSGPCQSLLDTDTGCLLKWPPASERKKKTLHHEANQVSKTSCPLRQNTIWNSKALPRFCCASENTGETSSDPTTKHCADNSRGFRGPGYFPKYPPRGVKGA